MSRGGARLAMQHRFRLLSCILDVSWLPSKSEPNRKQVYFNEHGTFKCLMLELGVLLKNAVIEKGYKMNEYMHGVHLSVFCGFGADISDIDILKPYVWPDTAIQESEEKKRV